MTRTTSAASPSTTARGRRAARDRLAAYRGKRDFARSPEPGGTALPRGEKAGARAFCVQKHLASHLHYDFRLEHRGVLLSWSVPKGPSLDPAVKRLAVQVEAHPLAYGGFEGVIPSGYGAGIVVLWDRGVWQPLDADVDAALATGELTFVLLGEKLKGSWVLVRLRRGDARHWMLIKHRDAWARSADITIEAPDSVLGSGDFAEVLAAHGGNPWPDQPPARGGAAGDLYRAVIRQAYAGPARRSRGPR